MSYRVLICDDSSLARKMARKCLPADFATDIEQASNGEEAVTLLQDKKFDLLLLDLTMPVLDGIGVLEQLKTLQIDTMVIVISGDIQPDMQARVKKLGALDFLAKPIDADRLMQTLKLYGFL